MTNDSAEFKTTALAAMEEHYKNQDLTPGYNALNTLLNIKNSEQCKTNKLCSLADGKNSFIIEAGKEPGVKGPLKMANSAVDAIDLQYYEGFPANDVAWGEITTPEQWKKLNTLKNGYQESLFTPRIIAKNVAHPLLSYINQHFAAATPENEAKFTFLAGHDSNIASLLSALEFKPYQLPEQYEHTPIGGKLVFQRWTDKKDNKSYVKINYIYQSSDQLRNTSYLSLKTPPKNVTLELKNCPVDKNGYCGWETFQKVMNDSLTQ